MAVSDLSFDDLIPKEKPKGLSFDDLIPKETTAAGLGKTAASAVPKGIANFLGMAGSMEGLVDPVNKWILSKVQPALSGMGISPETADMASKFSRLMNPLSFAGKVMPNAQSLLEASKPITGDLYEPQTRAEKTLDTTIQLGIGLGKPTPDKLLKVLAPTVAGTEIAGAATSDDPLWRAGGGLLGGGLAAGVNAWRGVPQKAVQRAIGDITPQEIAAAKQLEQEGKSIGGLLGAESLPNSGIQQLASNVLASPTGAPIMRKFLEGRPDAVKREVRGLLGEMAPYRSPTDIAQLGEKTAAQVLSGKNAENYMALGSTEARTARTAPFWEQQKVADLTAAEQQAQNAAQAANLKQIIDQWSGALPGRQASAANAIQQQGQQQALANEMRQLAERAKVTGLGAVGNQPAIELSRRSREAASTAADFGHVADQRKVEAAMAGVRLNNYQQRYAQLTQPKPSDLDYGLQSIVGNLDSEISLAGRTTDKGRILSDLRNQLADAKSVSQAENVYQAFSKRLQVGPTASAEERIAAGVLGEPVKALGSLTEQVSGPIRQGRALYRQITEQQTAPLQSSLVGKMAPKEGYYDAADPTNLGRVTGVLKGTDSAEITQLYTHLNAQNPQAFPAVARGMLEAHFDTATKRLQPGENVKLGANFANDVRGTDQQRANFDAILRGVADAQGRDGDTLVKGANVLMKTLEATGKVPGIGSPTAGRAAHTAEMSRNPISATTDMVSTKPLGMLGRMSESFFSARRNEILAQWMTDPNSVDLLIKMAKLKPDGVTARYYLMQLMNANKEANAGTD